MKTSLPSSSMNYLQNKEEENFKSSIMWNKTKTEKPFRLLAKSVSVHFVSLSKIFAENKADDITFGLEIPLILQEDLKCMYLRRASVKRVSIFVPEKAKVSLIDGKTQNKQSTA
ncbi:CLUMA_CG005139, isoform A [Clunio marinus]|uniref:CLUMA_CG005139, isoform A n=1 Tax=Clunio marinus TaxID=568069 RepID=A0A1J1HTS3_9DIPT|nr:CLUMA_CG005139, isoform A [Clunio marinus]